MKTLKKVNLILKEVDFIPEHNKMEFGVFYYSKKYNISNHLCVCGCGQQTALPIKKGEWEILCDKDKFSISPSILHRLGCQSHYIITNSIANIV